ncbi:MAG: 30S ribosomal protein S20 [Gemmatimonadaceae bacterium]
MVWPVDGAKRGGWDAVKLATVLARVKSAKPCRCLTSALSAGNIPGSQTSSSFSPRSRSVPRIASAEKNMRKSRAATVRNRAQRSALRTALKKAKASGANAKDKAAAVQLLDRAARKGLVHKNTAARHKSRIAKPLKG